MTLPEGGNSVSGVRYTHQIYRAADPFFTGRATVPVLYDYATGRVASNEAAEILRMLDVGFGPLASSPDLRPEDLQSEIQALKDRIYARFQNGVYRAGFATFPDREALDRDSHQPVRDPRPL